MSAIAKGKGQLFHKFHGNYWAQVIVGFESAELATAAALVLGAPWKQSVKAPEWVGCAVDSAGLDVEKQKLGRFGADVRKIDSLAKSVDCGEPFEVAIPVTLPVPEQAALPFGSAEGEAP